MAIGVAAACGGDARENAGGPPAADSLLPFVATGHEPEWRLEMTAEDLILSTDLGQSRLVVPTPEHRSDGVVRVYSSESGGGQLAVRLEPQVCSDSMSGMPHPFRVIVETGERVLGGCGGEPSDLLEGGPWTVEYLAGTDVVEGSPATLTFGDGRVAGNASCNEYTADYRLTGEGLRIGDAIRTERACVPSALMEQEDRFLALLRQVTRFSIGEDGGLVLHTGGEESLRAVR